MLLPSKEHDDHVRLLLNQSDELAARADECGKETAKQSKRLNMLHQDSAFLVDHCKKLRNSVTSESSGDE